MNAPSTADPNSSAVAARNQLSPNAACGRRPRAPMTPVCTSPATMTNSPMKNTSVGHSTSGSTSVTSTLVTSSIVPAPTSATIDGATCSTECSPNPTMTRASTARDRISSRVSLMARRSCNAITSSRWMSLARRSLRNSTLVSTTNDAKITTTAGAMWTRKSLNVRPARLPMMMLGGSPISVAAPPMLDASTSAIRKGCGAMRRRSQITRVTGATSMMMVTLSSTGEAMAVISISITMSRNGLPLGPFCRPDRQEVEHAGLLDHADDDHHAEQQEDDVPVDALVLGIEHFLAGDQAEHRHQAGGDQDRLDLVCALGGDEPEGDDEDRQRQHAEPARRAAGSVVGSGDCQAGEQPLQRHRTGQPAGAVDDGDQRAVSCSPSRSRSRAAWLPGRRWRAWRQGWAGSRRR